MTDVALPPLARLLAAALTRSSSSSSLLAPPAAGAPGAWLLHARRGLPGCLLLSSSHDHAAAALAHAATHCIALAVSAARSRFLPMNTIRVTRGSPGAHGRSPTAPPSSSPFLLRVRIGRVSSDAAIDICEGRSVAQARRRSSLSERFLLAAAAAAGGGGTTTNKERRERREQARMCGGEEGKEADPWRGGKHRK